MIVWAGDLDVETRVGTLHLDRTLDAAQLDVVVRIVERFEPDWVQGAIIDEGGALVRVMDRDTLDTSDVLVPLDEL